MGGNQPIQLPQTSVFSICIAISVVPWGGDKQMSVGFPPTVKFGNFEQFWRWDKPQQNIDFIAMIITQVWVMISQQGKLYKILQKWKQKAPKTKNGTAHFKNC